MNCVETISYILYKIGGKIYTNHHPLCSINDDVIIFDICEGHKGQQDMSRCHNYG